MWACINFKEINEKLEIYILEYDIKFEICLLLFIICMTKNINKQKIKFWCA